jgi:trk system potassium uptake protein TrkA
MKCVVIGLGSFGTQVAKTLSEAGHEVTAVDWDKQKIEDAKSVCACAVSMDSADRENLKGIGVQDADIVIVSLGPMMEASILTVLYLIELEVKRVIAKALSEEHAKVLEALGATEVIYPERDMAIKTATQLANPNVIEYLPITEGIHIQEISPPEKFIGKSLKELDLTNKFGISVIAIREIIPGKTTIVPKASFVVKNSDVLILIGEKSQLKKLNSK